MPNNTFKSSMGKISVSQENEKEKQVKEEKNLAVWDLGSPLYDSYEVVSVTHLIERHLMILPSYGGSIRLSSKKIHTPPGAVSAARNIHRPRHTRVTNSLVEFVRTKLWRRKRINGKQRMSVKSEKVTAASCSWLSVQTSK